MKIVYNEQQRDKICVGSLAPGSVCMDADDNYYMRINIDNIDINPTDDTVTVVDLGTGIATEFPRSHEFFPVTCALQVDR